MARPATGQVVERTGKAGRSVALRFHAYGRRRYLTLPAGTGRDAAEEELQNVLADVRRGVWQPHAPVEEPRPEPTFHAFASEWFAQHEPGLRSRTRDDYRWALSQHCCRSSRSIGWGRSRSRRSTATGRSSCA